LDHSSTTTGGSGVVIIFNGDGHWCCLFATALQLLQQEWQVLLPTSAGHESYQLWLPSWGVVLQALGTAATKILAEVKRNHYRERSTTSLQKMLQYSPIPVAVLVSRLVASRQVQRIQRPSGQFLKLSASAKEEYNNSTFRKCQKQK
jgi:hypothetical protein